MSSDAWRRIIWSARIGAVLASAVLPLTYRNIDHFGWGFFPSIVAVWVLGACIVSLAIDLCTLREDVPYVRKERALDALALAVPALLGVLAFWWEYTQY